MLEDPEHTIGEAEAAFNDPETRLRLEEFDRQLAAGTLRTYSTREVIERLGLDPDLLLDLALGSEE